MNNNTREKAADCPQLLLNHKTCTVVAILLGLIGGLSVEAASFDCAKSTTQVEKLICEDRLLSYQDEKLNLIYRAVLKKSPQADNLRQGQRKWLGGRDLCQDNICLQQSYASRISELALSLDAVRNTNDENAACNTVAGYANRGELSELYVSVEKNDLPAIQKHFSNLSGVTGYWYVDFDNDGVRDPIVVKTAGTGHYASLEAKLSRYSNIFVGLENAYEEGEFDISFIAVSGKYYVLSRDGDRLMRMFHVAKGGISPICEFKQRETPQVEIANGSDEPVCKFVLSEKVNYIPFPPMLYFLNDYDMLVGEVMADITNTGQQTKVSLVNMLIPGGRGCSWLEIKVEDEKNPEQLNSLTNKSVCNSKQDLFVLDGKTYIDERSKSTNWPRSVHMGIGKEVSEICTFESRPYYEVNLVGGEPQRAL